MRSPARSLLVDPTSPTRRPSSARATPGCATSSSGSVRSASRSSSRSRCPSRPTGTTSPVAPQRCSSPSSADPPVKNLFDSAGTDSPAVEPRVATVTPGDGATRGGFAMRRSTLRLYGPFLAIALVQALFIVAAPSRAPGRQQLSTGSGFQSGANGTASGAPGSTGAGGTSATGGTSGVPGAAGSTPGAG